jgi:CRISPR/Cas system-associated exonuclease Cas4 (RecB family)
LFSYISKVNADVRSDDTLRGNRLRFGKDYLAVGWLNTLGYCEYKFEFMREEGVPLDVAIASLPDEVREDAQLHLANKEADMDDGVGKHERVANSLVGADERSELEVSAPYVGLTCSGDACAVPILGRVDALEVGDGGLRVIDWKTGDAPKRNDPWNGDVLQVLGYCYVLRYMLDLSPTFKDLPLTGIICYTQTGQRFSVDYDSRQSVVRTGFSQFRLWSDFTPSGLVRDKLLRLWSYWSGCRDAAPPYEHNREGKCQGCEYKHVCEMSPFCRL